MVVAHLPYEAHKVQRKLLISILVSVLLTPLCYVCQRLKLFFSVRVRVLVRYELWVSSKIAIFFPRRTGVIFSKLSCYRVQFVTYYNDLAEVNEVDKTLAR